MFLFLLLLLLLLYLKIEAVNQISVKNPYRVSLIMSSLCLVLVNVWFLLSLGV